MRSSDDSPFPPPFCVPLTEEWLRLSRMGRRKKNAIRKSAAQRFYQPMALPRRIRHGLT